MSAKYFIIVTIHYYHGMQKLPPEKKIHYTLRIASAMCFIGHGSFGIMTKPIWINYFAVFGIGHELSFKLMPVLGTFDVLMGILLLVFPLRVIPLWLVVWGTVTALLRPLSGEPFAEFIERAANFGAPLALILLAGPGVVQFKNWFKRINSGIHPDSKTYERVAFWLGIAVFLLLLGHGGLNLIEKKGLTEQYASLGFSHPGGTAQIIGMFEILAAVAILIRPVRSLVLALFFWKMLSELFYPQHEIFEFIERGGSYGCLLALYFILDLTPSPVLSFWRPPQLSP